MSTITICRDETRIQSEIKNSFADAVKFELQRVKCTLTLLNRRSVERNQLLRLEDYLLKDIGISHQDAVLEARKPFWKR